MLVLLVIGYSFGQEWSSLSFINFTHQQRELLKNHRYMIFKKDLNLLATQILFSWNMFRPEVGYYTFYMQVHSATNNRWGNWIKIAEWGKDVQRSFERKYDLEPSFFFVRWQMLPSEVVDEVRIKVQAENGASLKSLYRLAITSIYDPAFSSEHGQGKRFEASSFVIKNIPPISQMEVNHKDRNRICSPTALSMVASYLNGNYEDPENFVEGVYDHGLQTYGSWPFNVAHAFDHCKGRFYFSVTRLNSFKELYHYLENRMPVVVSVRGSLKTMPLGKTYEDGHLLVVAGWDNEKKEVICYDPAFALKRQVLHRYDIDEFLKAWERSKRLSYVIEPHLE